MSPVPRDTTGGRVFNDLRNKAQRESRATEELLVLYVIERWLYRASISRLADRFILKGGLLLAVLDARRPTRDGDLLARLARDETELVSLVSEIALIEVDDGVAYDVAQGRSVGIREEDRYAGVRIVMPATLARARVKLALDVNVGDPVVPGVVRVAYPSLLPGGGFDVFAYPVETVLAEKIVTAVARGETNSRDRDWADMWRLTRVHSIAGATLTEAVRRTADHRGVTLRPLTDQVGALIDLRAAPYRRWRSQQGVDGAAYPPEWAPLVTEVIRFADPVLTGSVIGQHWHHRDRMWRGA